MEVNLLPFHSILSSFIEHAYLLYGLIEKKSLAQCTHTHACCPSRLSWLFWGITNQSVNSKSTTNEKNECKKDLQCFASH